MLKENASALAKEHLPIQNVVWKSVWMHTGDIKALVAEEIKQSLIQQHDKVSLHCYVCRHPGLTGGLNDTQSIMIAKLRRDTKPVQDEERDRH